MQKTNASSPTWLVVLKALALLALTILSLLAAAKLFPPPKGQGLALVAVPFYGLLYGLLASLVYLVLGLMRKPYAPKVFWLALLTIIGWNFLLFILI